MPRTVITKTCLFIALSAVCFAFTKPASISILISSPDAKSVYKFRDTVWIKAEISATESLHDISIRVISLKDSSVIYTKSLHSHSSSLSIREYYINPVFEKSDVKLSIWTTGHEGKATAKSEVVFKCLAKKKSR